MARFEKTAFGLDKSQNCFFKIKRDGLTIADLKMILFHSGQKWICYEKE